MPRNGTGAYSLVNNSWNPAINGVSATAADWQALINDVASAIQQSVSSDGQTTMTGSLHMGGFVIDGLGTPSGAGQSLRWQQLTKGADIASTAALPIPIEGSYFVVTGTTTITSIVDVYPGRMAFLKFAAACQLTNSASLILPQGVNITTKANDVALFVNDSPGVWLCLLYRRSSSNGLPSFLQASVPTADIGEIWVEGIGACRWNSTDSKYYRIPLYNNSQLITASGNFTPDAFTKTGRATLIGGGGAGGASAAPGASNVSGSGAGGSPGTILFQQIVTLTPGVAMPVVIGAGGLGSASGSAGGAASTFAGLSASGGLRGGDASGQVGGISIGPGAGSSQNGGPSATFLPSPGGAGGSSFFGPGGAGGTGNSGGISAPATSYGAGGGGSGASGASNPARAGGNGAPGALLIEW